MGRKTRSYGPHHHRRPQKIAAAATLGMSDLLWRIGRRDAWICWVCDAKVSFHESEPLHYATKDHLIPRGKGGPDALWNLRLCHYTCNASRKHDVPPPPHVLLKNVDPSTYPRLLERFARAYGYSFATYKRDFGREASCEDAA